MNPQPIADYACETGENPLWHPLEKRLYWTDIPTGRLFWYDPATGRHQQCYQGRPVGGFTVQADGALLLFMDRGTVAIWRDGKIVRTIIEQIPDEITTRFNDVIADPTGRVFCGTMPTSQRPGRLYRLDRNGTIHLLLEGIGISNGMGFTPDGSKMYYTDSLARTIYIFDYDRATGAIANQQIWITIPASRSGEGVPDGMTVDAAGDVWGTRWDGGCVVRYDPQGIEKGRIVLPVPKVSSAAFGGDDYGDLYLTTAGGKIKDKDGPLAGALFRMDLRPMHIHGVSEFHSRID